MKRLACVALLASACAQEVPRPDLTIVATNSLLGNVEPCGCVTGQFGGIKRQLGSVEAIRAEGQPVLVLDAGDLLSEHRHHGEVERIQWPVRAEALGAFLDAAGCRAMALGESDLALGVDLLLRWAANRSFPVLSANVAAAPGSGASAPGGRRVMLQAAGLKIGVTSVTGIRFDRPEQVKSTVFSAKLLFDEWGLVVKPAAEAARREAAALRADGADMVVLLAHMTSGQVDKLLAEVEGIDLVIAPPHGEPAAPVRRVGGTLVATGALKGTRVLRIDVFLDGGQVPASWGDDSEIAQVRDRVGDLNVTLAAYEAGYEGDGAEDSRTTLAHRRNALALAQERLTGLEDGTGGRFAVSVPSMHPWVPESATAAGIVDRYRDQVAALWRSMPSDPEHRTVLEMEGAPAFRGPGSCEACHVEQAAFWQQTSHARAYATLEATRQEMDVDCFRCHVTGWRQPGGFAMPAEPGRYRNVSCEVCHGPGSTHIASAAAHLDPGTIVGPSVGMDCVRCHNKDHSPRFDPERYVPRVSCPPIDPRTPTMQATYGDAVDELAGPAAAGDGLAQRLLLRAHLSLADGPGAEAAARAVLERQAHDPEAVLALARALVLQGRRTDCVAFMEREVAWDGTEPAYRAALAMGLEGSDQERARQEARMAVSLDPGNVRWRELLARLGG